MHYTIFKRAEQTVLALLLLAALTAMTGYWVFRVWHRRDLVEFDTAPPLEATFQIDINQADWPELMQLPGIGKKTAQSIVEARDLGGPFKNLEDLASRVHGVGPRMTTAIRPFVVPTQNPKTSLGGQEP